MKSFQKDRTLIKKSSLILWGGIAGALNGFLGSGGGIILLYLFRRLNKGKKEGERDAFASVVAAILPMCAVSAVVYSSRGMGRTEEFLPFAVSAVMGGLAGAALTERLDTATLRKIFSVIITVAGINMLL